VNRELTASHNQCDGCERNGVEVVMAGGNDIEAERLRAMANKVGWHRVKAVHSSSLSLFFVSSAREVFGSPRLSSISG
jgi:hypothetical protein